MYKSLGPILERYRILLCPTLPLPATKAGESYVGKKLMINRKPQQSISHWLMTTCFNIMTGVYRPTSGDIRLEGRSLARMKRGSGGGRRQGMRTVTTGDGGGPHR